MDMHQNINRVELQGIVGTSKVTSIGDKKTIRFSLATNYTYKAILGLTDVDCKKIFTINRLDNKDGRSFFREVFIRRGTTSGVYGVEEPHECYMTYTTERAGQAPSETTHFSWRANNLSVYKAFTHQHLGEIGETLHTLAPSYEGELNFVPVRGDFTRGILASVYFDCDLSEEEAVALYKDYYKDEPFVHVIDTNPDLKMVVNTNKCVLNVRKHGRKLHVISIIDNLVKGASGQAVENMNLIFGLPEGTGLHLKGTRF